MDHKTGTGQLLMAVPFLKKNSNPCSALLLKLYYFFEIMLFSNNNFQDAGTGRYVT